MVNSFFAVFVTSLAEVWIEIEENGAFPVPTTVTSLAEVWIEMILDLIDLRNYNVTSLAEVWIEMYKYQNDSSVGIGHFPCGSVD